MKDLLGGPKFTEPIDDNSKHVFPVLTIPTHSSTLRHWYQSGVNVGLLCNSVQKALQISIKVKKLRIIFGANLKDKFSLIAKMQKAGILDNFHS